MADSESAQRLRWVFLGVRFSSAQAAANVYVMGDSIGEGVAIASGAR